MTSGTDQSRFILCNLTGFLFAFQVCLTFLLFQSNPQIGTATTVGVTLGWLLIVLGYSIFVPQPKCGDPRVPRPLRWIAIYLCLAAASLLWTGAGSVPVAACYWSAMAADVGIVFVLLRYNPAEQNAARVMRGFICGSATVALVAWLIPRMEDMRLGNEEFLHPNMLGLEFAIAALFAGYLAQTNKSWIWLLGGFVVTLIRTLSKGAIVGFVCASLYYLLRGLKLSHKARVYLGVVTTVVVVGFWGLLEAYLDLYTQGSNLETLTGRTYIWTQSLDIAAEKPWFGHGFDSFRWVFPAFDDFQPWQAHNEFIQQFFAYGVIGVLVVGTVYLAFYRQVHRSIQSSLKSLAMAILILVLVRGLVDTDRFELCFPLWLMTLLSISLASSSAQQRTISS